MSMTPLNLKVFRSIARFAHSPFSLGSTTEWQNHPADVNLPLTTKTYVSVMLVGDFLRLVLSILLRVNNPVAIWEQVAKTVL